MNPSYSVVAKLEVCNVQVTRLKRRVRMTPIPLFWPERGRNVWEET